MTRYEKLAEELAALIERGVLRPGERLPSSRQLARSHEVSVGTVLQAYYRLEARGLVQARPRSGYYVNATRNVLAGAPRVSTPSPRAEKVDISELVFQVLDEIRDRELVALGSAFPSPLLFPLDKLAQFLGKSARRLDPWQTVEDMSPGSSELRRQIAKRYAAHGMPVLPEDIIVTSGALEALNLCLQAVTRPGDVVAVETPAFYGALQTAERLGLRAVGIATHPAEGVDLGSLEQAIRKHDVKACWFMPNFQNPLGSLMPVQKKQDLVRLLARHRIPLVEDDVYAELYFGAQRPPPAKAFDRDGLVMHCSSFSKSVAPGYRVGWCAPGQFAQKVARLKLTTSIATSVPVQGALAQYLRHGGYDRHLRELRRFFRLQQRTMLEAIGRHFPPGTRVTQPEGGYFLWVELSEGIDTMELHRQALQHGIGIAPGPMFANRRKFDNCLRLNYGHPGADKLAAAVATLGKLAGVCARVPPASGGRQRRHGGIPD
jgi:DNA-binding transcriptional MocR family regulator